MKKTLIRLSLVMIATALVFTGCKKDQEDENNGGNGGGTIINGYTLEMMIWYMIMAEIFMYAVNSRGVTRAFGSDIKSGKIAYQLNKPYNYYFYHTIYLCHSFYYPNK